MSDFQNEHRAEYKTYAPTFKPLDIVVPCTVQDILEIGNCANVIEKAFDVSREDAIRAAICLKESELGRSLTALRNLL